MEHCKKDFNNFEQYITCIKCGHSLSDNQLIKDAYKLNTTAAWAKSQLKIVIDMIGDRKEDGISQIDAVWFMHELDRIKNAIRLLSNDK